VLLVAYDAVVAVTAYDAVVAKEAVPAIDEPLASVTEPDNIVLPVTVSEPEMYGELSIIYCVLYKYF
jgi:hypothetical protein